MKLRPETAGGIDLLMRLSLRARHAAATPPGLPNAKSIRECAQVPAKETKGKIGRQEALRDEKLAQQDILEQPKNVSGALP